MENLSVDPTFRAYVMAVLALCVNLLALWGWSGGVRVKTKTVMNPEDSSTVSKGADLVAVDPARVARVLRAHANAMANIVPFFAMGLLFVLLGGDSLLGQVLFAAFVALRWLHSVVYLAEKQPWRTLSFVGSALTLLVLLGVDGWLLMH